MRRALLLLAIASILLLTTVLGGPERADALSSTCLQGPLPTVPLPPVFTINRSSLTIDIWRQACTDGTGQTAALARITPSQGTSPNVCSTQFVLVQNTNVLNGRITLNLAGPAFCSTLAVATTFFLLENFLEPFPLNATQAFTVYYTPTGSSTFSQIDVPAPSPLAATTPSLAIIPTGCTTCHSLGIMGFNVSITNPGAPMVVQVKFGGRLADGSILPVLGPDHEEVLPAGKTLILNVLPNFTLPNNVPAVDLQMEAALVEPQLGVTIVRTTQTVHMSP